MLGYHCGVKARMEGASNKGGRVHRDSVPWMVERMGAWSAESIRGSASCGSASWPWLLDSGGAWREMR